MWPCKRTTVYCLQNPSRVSRYFSKIVIRVLKMVILSKKVVNNRKPRTRMEAKLFLFSLVVENFLRRRENNNKAVSNYTRSPAVRKKTTNKNLSAVSPPHTRTSILSWTEFWMSVGQQEELLCHFVPRVRKRRANYQEPIDSKERL